MKKIAGIVLGTFLLFGGVLGFQSSASASELNSTNFNVQNEEINPMDIF